MASGLIDSSRARNSSLLRILSGWVTGMPAARAVCFTAGATSSWLRPAGRSGWVTANGISWPARMSASNVGTPNLGVPQKTSFIDVPSNGILCSPMPQRQTWGAQRHERGTLGLPRTLALHFADLAQRHIPLQAAHAKDEQHSVQVVNLVLKGARQQFLAVHLKPLAVLVLGADGHLGGAHHFLADLGETEAAFFFVLPAFLRSEEHTS